MQNAAKNDYIWNTLGVLLQNAVSPILLLIVTRVNGIFNSGVFSFAFSVSLLLWAFGMWGGRTYQVSDTQSEFEHRSYVLVRILLAVAMLAIAWIFCVINHYDIFKTLLIFGLVAFKVLESLADVLYGILQVHKKLYMSGRSLTIKALLGISVFTIIDIMTHDILLAVMAVIGVNLVVLCIYDFVQANKLEPIKFPPQQLKRYMHEALAILRRCSGVFIVFFLAMFSLNIPRYFIDLHDEKEVGVFGIIAMPITLIVLLISFILQPNIVQLAKLYRQKKYDEFSAVVRRIVVVSFVIGIAVLLATAAIGPQILKLVFGVDFDEYRIALVVIVAGGVASALVTVYINLFVIMRKIKVAVWTLVISNIALTIVAYTVVIQWQLLGGVWSFMITNIIQLAILYSYFKLIQRKMYE